jgi:phage-related holin
MAKNLYSDGLRQAKNMNLLHKPNRMMVYGEIIAVYCEVKVAFTIEQVLKAQGWSRVMALLFL